MSMIHVSKDESTGGHTWEMMWSKNARCSYCKMLLGQNLYIDDGVPRNELFVVGTGERYDFYSMRCTKPVTMEEVKAFMLERGSSPIDESDGEVKFAFDIGSNHGGYMCFLSQKERTTAYARNKNHTIINTHCYYGHPADGVWLVSGNGRHENDKPVGINKAYVGMKEKLLNQ